MYILIFLFLDKFTRSTNLATLFVCTYCSFFSFCKKKILDHFSLSTNLATLFCACIVVVFCVFFGKKINILNQFSQSTNLATFFVWTYCCLLMFL